MAMAECKTYVVFDYGGGDEQTSEIFYDEFVLKGLCNSTHIIVENWKPFNQEDESAWPEDYHDGQLYLVKEEDSDWPIVVEFYANTLWIAGHRRYEDVTHYMPIPEGE
jgi:hypothetical protein